MTVEEPLYLRGSTALAQLQDKSNKIHIRL